MKVKRDAFLYLEPTYVNREMFAQCATCVMFNRNNYACSIFDSPVREIGSCDFYMEGLFIDMIPRIIVTREEAGYVEREVRCENCKFGMDGRCGLYLQLNSMFPDLFDLDPKISPYGCCNANTEKDST